MACERRVGIRSPQIWVTFQVVVLLFLVWLEFWYISGVDTMIILLLLLVTIIVITTPPPFSLSLPPFSYTSFLLQGFLIPAPILPLRSHFRPDSRVCSLPTSRNNLTICRFWIYEDPSGGKVTSGVVLALCCSFQASDWWFNKRPKIQGPLPTS